MNLSQLLYVAGGLKYTVLFGFVSVFLGIIIGFFSAFFRFSNVNSWWSFVLSSYSSLFRGTPLMVQLLFCCFFLTKLFPFGFVVWCLVVLVFNSGAYLSEVFLDTLNSIPLVYWETSFGLDLPKREVVKFLLLDLIFKNCKQTLICEMVTILKETTLLSVFSIEEVSLRAKYVGSVDFNYLPPLFLAGFFFYATSWITENLLGSRFLSLAKRTIFILL